MLSYQSTDLALKPVFQSDWEASSEEEEAVPAPVSNAAPPKKKGTIKAKLAEKEAAKRAAAENGDVDDLYDEEAVLDPREKARRDRERELKSDLDNAASLLGSSGSKASMSATCHIPLDTDYFQLHKLLQLYWT